MTLSNTARLDHNNAPTQEIRKNRSALLGIAEEMVREVTKESSNPKWAIEARVEGNVRPGIMVKFNPQSTSILKVIRIAEGNDLRVADAYQLERDTEDGIMRLRFKSERHYK